MNIMQKIGSHVRKNLGKYAAAGSLAYLLSTCEPMPKNGVVDTGREIDSVHVTKSAIDTTESLEPTFGVQYFANTKKGFIPITKDNLYMNNVGQDFWNQSTHGYERTTAQIRREYPNRNWMAVMVNDTLYSFLPSEAYIGFDGLSPVPVTQK